MCDYEGCKRPDWTCGNLITNRNGDADEFCICSHHYYKISGHKHKGVPKLSGKKVIGEIEVNLD